MKRTIYEAPASSHLLPFKSTYSRKHPVLKINIRSTLRVCGIRIHKKRLATLWSSCALQFTAVLSFVQSAVPFFSVSIFAWTVHVVFRQSHRSLPVAKLHVTGVILYEILLTSVSIHRSTFYWCSASLI